MRAKKNSGVGKGLGGGASAPILPAPIYGLVLLTVNCKITDGNQSIRPIYVASGAEPRFHDWLLEPNKLSFFLVKISISLSLLSFFFKSQILGMSGLSSV